jgi:hypothetical protein
VTWSDEIYSRLDGVSPYLAEQVRANPQKQERPGGEREVGERGLSRCVANLPRHAGRKRMTMAGIVALLP